MIGAGRRNMHHGLTRHCLRKEMWPMNIMTRSILATLAVCALSLPAWGMSVTLTTVTTVDNYYDLYIDNAQVIHIASTSSGWDSPETWTGNVATDAKHSISVKASNYTPWSGENPAAFLGQVDAGTSLYFVETHGQVVVTNATWKVWYGGVDATPPVVNGLAWTDPNYDDSTWNSAFDIGPNGISPWGNVNGISSSADWIWTQNYNGNNADTPVYFRMTLTPAEAGGPSIPEPLTMMGVFAAIAGAGAYIRRRQVSV